MLKDKIAVITGGARGIGRAIADKLALNGAQIVILDMNKPEETDYSYYKCNVSDFSESETVIKSILDRFGRIDILVNNAGITRDKLTLAMTESEFDAVVNVNLKGTFNMIRHTYRQFMKNKRGKIINIASVVCMMGNVGQANYSASKAGVIGLTKSVAKELASRGINCNAIAPGFIGTSMTGAMTEDAKNEIMKSIPMKRIGTPEDVADLALFLASACSDYITGEIIKIDGGLYI
ncbi:MAG: 3-oxoacyl-[acyl-carrier-protein] reductase [Eubacteriales bacterium]|nr:3-oxoacyl-[acyl-carrier-protein] reductase [Eubacteriales bacterium]